jgi:hypothetical protein
VPNKNIDLYKGSFHKFPTRVTFIVHHIEVINLETRHTCLSLICGLGLPLVFAGHLVVVVFAQVEWTTLASPTSPIHHDDTNNGAGGDKSEEKEGMGGGIANENEDVKDQSFEEGMGKQDIQKIGEITVN